LIRKPEDMKKKNTILLLGILSIIILIAAQVIIIKGIWKTTGEMLPLRYRSLSMEAVSRIRGSRSINPFDTVEYILNQYSATAASELQQITDTQKLEQKKKEILEYFTWTLNMEQDLTNLLSSYYESQGFEKEFIHKIEIDNLDIITQDTVNIYRNESMRERRRPGRERTGPPPERDSRSNLYTIGWHLERNYYSMNFRYIIDFSDKRKMILQESAVSFGMSIFSIAVVVLLFLITYRNLMEEQRLSNLKTDFINNMTHELKTPLATITVAGKTLEMERIRTDELKVLETAKLIGKQSVHLNQLINMILEISIWERTQFQLDRKKVDIEEIMNDIVTSFKSGPGNIASLSQKYAFNGIKADIDLIYFTTLINNLLSNAVKYSATDPIINVEGYADERNIFIRIIDNGIGISKTDQKHIFDKFYRASSGNIHKFKGLGLGLYYVKKIAVAHGGDVMVSSKPGKGSIFTVAIPY
jgi:signal transduction histidine kinase